MTTASLNRVLALARARRYAETGEGHRIRRRHRLSLHECATATGTSVTTLWRWENGRNAPQGDAAVRWSRLLEDLESQAGPHAAA